jgi:Holliday junction resolvase
MSKGPEANFWNTIRQNIPKKWFATRIENKHGGGIPDVHIVADGVPFWIELKTSKSNGVNLSPHQVAWNMAYFARGGANFILVKHLPTRHLYLFGGDKGPSLVDRGIAGTEGERFEDLGSLFEALRPHAARVLGIGE